MKKVDGTLMSMDYFRINRLTESDFDCMVERAGGSRVSISLDGRSEESADYLLADAAVELKLVDEEGFEKEERQVKLAGLFRGHSGNKPVIVADPSVLDDIDRRRYYDILRGPIKTHVKKAARQTDATAKREDKASRVLLIINNGYAALTHEEFKEVVLKCTRNDTKRIDHVVIGGMYHYSDGFDSYFLMPFECVAINVDHPFAGFKSLHTAWSDFVEDFMTAVVQGKRDPNDNDRLPVLELTFEHDGNTFVKPAPKMGKKSEFWPDGGRPRDNSTGISECPTVAKTFPMLAKEDWLEAKKALAYEDVLCDSYEAWTTRMREEESKFGKPLMPFVPVAVTWAECVSSCKEQGIDTSFAELCRLANDLFHIHVRRLIGQAQDKMKFSLTVEDYVFLRVDEIGQDKANDLSSIFRVSERVGLERCEPIVENQKLFFEYALALAAAYAVKRQLSLVLYLRDNTHAPG